MRRFALPTALGASLWVATPILGVSGAGAQPLVLAPPSAPEPVDHSFDPPPPPPRTLAKGLLLGGGVLFGSGLVGTLLTPHCATRNAREECVDPQGSAPLFPLLMAAGLVVGVVAGAMWRNELEPAR